MQPHLWRDRAVRSVAVQFVEAEYCSDRQTLKALATGPLAGDIAKRNVGGR